MVFPSPIVSLEEARSTPVTLMVGTLTVTLHVALCPPSAVVAVIVAVPTETALTTPPSTVATLELLVVHTTVLSVALLGDTVALSVRLSPTSMAAEVLSRATPVTSMDPVTVTSHVALYPPSVVVAVMVAVPAETAETFPLLTVATLALLVDHLTVVSAPAGMTVAFRVRVSPFSRDASLLSRVIPVTGTVHLA